MTARLNSIELVKSPGREFVPTLANFRKDFAVRAFDDNTKAGTKKASELINVQKHQVATIPMKCTLFGQAPIALEKGDRIYTSIAAGDLVDCIQSNTKIFEEYDCQFELEYVFHKPSKPIAAPKNTPDRVLQVISNPYSDDKSNANISLPVVGLPPGIVIAQTVAFERWPTTTAGKKIFYNVLSDIDSAAIDINGGMQLSSYHKKYSDHNLKHHKNGLKILFSELDECTCLRNNRTGLVQIDGDVLNTQVKINPAIIQTNRITFRVNTLVEGYRLMST